MNKYMRFATVMLILAAVIPMFGYVPWRDLKPSGIVQIRWPSGNGTNFRVNPTQGTNITGARTLSQVFVASFASWDAVTTADVSFTQGPDVGS